MTIWKKSKKNKIEISDMPKDSLAEITPGLYNNKLHEIIGKALIIASIIYVLLYSFLPVNPDYGVHASTSSNVGRDHRFLFAIWGILVGTALIVNLFYMLKKYNIKSKLPKIMCLFGGIGVLGFISFENDKFQKYRLSFAKEQYSGKVTDKIQTFEYSIPRFDFLFTKKTLHTAFAIIFGLCIAAALLYCMFYLSKRAIKFKYLTICFMLYMIITATVLGLKLSGLTEAIALDVAFGFVYILCYFTDSQDILCKIRNSK